MFEFFSSYKSTIQLLTPLAFQCPPFVLEFHFFYFKLGPQTVYTVQYFSSIYFGHLFFDFILLNKTFSELSFKFKFKFEKCEYFFRC